MLNKHLIAAAALLLSGAGRIQAQSNIDARNPALELLRSGVWVERGSFDSFQPMRDDAVSPVGGGRAAAIRMVGYDAPPVRLDPPNLNSTWQPTPVPVEVQRAAARAEPIVAARAEPIAAVPVAVEMRAAIVARISPCDDLRMKAQRLRNAASQCDTDVSNGAPYCHVQVNFDSPAIPRTLYVSEARDYARQFENAAANGNDLYCAENGGEGAMRPAIPVPMEAAPGRVASPDSPRKRCMDAYLRNNYNSFVADTLVPYFSAGSIGSRRYWEGVLESTVVKGSILGALGVGGAYYSTREFEALGKSLHDFGWLGIVARRNVIIGSATRAAHLATAQAFLEGTVGVAVAGGGSFATTAHAMAYSACASEAP